MSDENANMMMAGVSTPNLMFSSPLKSQSYPLVPSTSSSMIASPSPMNLLGNVDALVPMLPPPPPPPMMAADDMDMLVASAPQHQPQQDRTRLRVKLNIGGTRYEVAVATIDRFAETLLGGLVAGPCPPSDELFFDRDPRLFDPILNYYRTGKLRLPADPFITEELLDDELEFWMMNLSDSVVDAAFESQRRSLGRPTADSFSNASDDMNVAAHVVEEEAEEEEPEPTWQEIYEDMTAEERRLACWERVHGNSPAIREALDAISWTLGVVVNAVVVKKTSSQEDDELLPLPSAEDMGSAVPSVDAALIADISVLPPPPVVEGDEEDDSPSAEELQERRGSISERDWVWMMCVGYFRLNDLTRCKQWLARLQQISPDDRDATTLTILVEDKKSSIVGIGAAFFALCAGFAFAFYRAKNNL